MLAVLEHKAVYEFGGQTDYRPIGVWVWDDDLVIRYLSGHEKEAECAKATYEMLMVELGDRVTSRTLLKTLRENTARVFGHVHEIQTDMSATDYANRVIARLENGKRNSV